MLVIFLKKSWFKESHGWNVEMKTKNRKNITVGICWMITISSVQVHNPNAPLVLASGDLRNLRCESLRKAGRTMRGVGFSDLFRNKVPLLGSAIASSQ